MSTREVILATVRFASPANGICTTRNRYSLPGKEEEAMVVAHTRCKKLVNDMHYVRGASSVHHKLVPTISCQRIKKMQELLPRSNTCR